MDNLVLYNNVCQILKMGTRSWSSFQKCNLGENIYVKAWYFDIDSDTVTTSDSKWRPY